MKGKNEYNSKFGKNVSTIIFQHISFKQNTHAINTTHQKALETSKYSKRSYFQQEILIFIGKKAIAVVGVCVHHKSFLGSKVIVWNAYFASTWKLLPRGSF